MHPITEIVYNYDYAKRLYRGEGNFEDVWRNIVGRGADFETVFNEYIGVILDLIEKFTGFAWEEFADLSMPIYLIEGGESFCHPLSLVVSDDPRAMLEDCIYQLAHRNMYFGFVSDGEQAGWFTDVTAHVLEDLGVEKPARHAHDLRVASVKHYLKR
ncbi:MAG: hypothetical protein WC544_03615 [Patescibacteria group bacterium]